ncbi:hypothetical protein HWV62_32417 [Athelia sp. TMB]|nr:hypothetical protein HWV62_32417 [Athelia sp. TMB]
MSDLAPVEIWRDSFDSAVSLANGGGSARTNIEQPGSAPSPTSTAATPRARRLLPLAAMPSSAKKMLRSGAHIASITASTGTPPFPHPPSLQSAHLWVVQRWLKGADTGILARGDG